MVCPLGHRQRELCRQGSPRSRYEVDTTGSSSSRSAESVLGVTCRHRRQATSPDMWAEPEELNDCADCELDNLENRLTAAGYIVGRIDL